MTSTQQPAPGAARTLDYRAGADHREVRLARVQRELTVGESLNGAAVALRLALGIPLALIGPFVLTVFLAFIELRLRNDVFFGFGGTFCLLTVVLIPLLMWYERRSRGEFLTDAVRGETRPLQASSYGEYELQSAKFSAIGWTEVALTGPRLLWEAIDSLRRRAPAARPIRTLAAELVVDLYDAGEGVSPQKLVRPDRPLAAVFAGIDYLARRDWIGLSSRRDRVWLSSILRERLRGL